MVTQIKQTKQETKKRFFEVKAPITATKILLYAATAQELDGKAVTIDLTRHLRGKSVEMKLRVHAQGDELSAEPISLVIVGSYIRRMTRKGTDYVEDSFTTECKDARIIIKPFLITRNKVSRAVRNGLRTTAKQTLIAHFTTRTTKEIFSEILAGKIQKELSLKLKKIYPLALCEIRIFGIVDKKKEFDVKSSSQ